MLRKNTDRFRKKILVTLFLLVILIIVFTLNKTTLKTYVNVESGWEIQYLNSLTISSRETDDVVVKNGIGKAIKFWRFGPTQNEGTEFHDGLFIEIFTVTKDAQTSLEQFAIENSKSYYPPTTNQATKINVNEIIGYQTVRNEYGRTTQVFLPYKNSDDKVLWFIIFAEGKNKQKYEQEYKKMLNTFRFI